MTHENQLIFIAFMAAVAMAVVELAEQSWASQADAREKETCVDGPDTTAWIARRPGESHNREACEHFIRFGSPFWVPEMGSPLPPDKMPK